MNSVEYTIRVEAFSIGGSTLSHAQQSLKDVWDKVNLGESNQIGLILCSRIMITFWCPIFSQSTGIVSIDSDIGVSVHRFVTFSRLSTCSVSSHEIETKLWMWIGRFAWSSGGFPPRKQGQWHGSASNANSVVWSFGGRCFRDCAPRKIDAAISHQIQLGSARSATISTE